MTVCSLLFYANCVWGQSYLPMEALDLNAFPPPPPLDSIESQQDMNLVLHWQLTRSSADCLRVSTEEDGLATSFFGPPFGPLSSEHAQRLVDFQEKLFKQVNFFNRHLKKRFARLRPYQQSKDVIPCIDHSHPSLSYPSGHAAVATLAALSFSYVYPQYSEALINRGKEIALGRVVGGVHYPSDVEAGKLLAQEIFVLLLEEQKFLDDLSQLK